ncbi:MAG: N-acetylmuramoyl-L-alanine amidase, partial [Alphaproteobacteria bacterium]
GSDGRPDILPRLAGIADGAPAAVAGRRIIVVDAGHGGNDPGAPGVAGVPEKKITLDVAREAARQLEATGRYHALLTRDRDVYIGLRDRVAFARHHKADLFVSLHADSIKNRRVRGATVYTLSETASDAEAADLAARENKADILAGLDLDVEAPEVANILIDLAQRETMNYSARFANYLLPELKDRVVLRRNSHRFAGFVVLKAPDVPSVLVEMGYMSNRDDARFLGSARGRKEIAAALVAAVDRYFRAVEREQF